MSKLSKKDKNFRLSEREKLVAMYIANGETHKKAIQLAGYSPNTSTSQITSRVSLREEILRIMDEKGMDSSLVQSKIMEGLNATKYIGTKDNWLEVPDHLTRHKYLETMLKLMDAYPSTKVDLSVETVEDRLRRLYGGG